MPVYTVHEPPLRDGEDSAAVADRVMFVRDKFSTWAFLFGPFWMIWRGLWLVLLLSIVLMTALQVGLWALGAATVVKFIVGLLVALLIGFEAASLRRWTLARRGWINRGVVVADGEESAERRFFDVWIANEARPAPVVSVPAASQPLPYRTAADPPDVIGLFPEPQSRR